MDESISKLKMDIYEIEASLAQQQFLLEIIRDFGQYNSENSDGVQKMTYLLNILYKKQISLRKHLDKFIPRFHEGINRVL